MEQRRSYFEHNHGDKHNDKHEAPGSDDQNMKDKTGCAPAWGNDLNAVVGLYYSHPTALEGVGHEC
jgi:hypothetical protein